MLEQHNSPSSHKRKLPPLLKLAILFAAVAISIYIVFSITLGGHAGVFPTTVTLKREGCELMQQEGIAIQRNHNSASICTVTAEYRANLFRNGGEIFIEDRGIIIADNQLVATELVDEKAAIRSRLFDVIMLILCSGFLMGTLLALARL